MPIGARCSHSWHSNNMSHRRRSHASHSLLRGSVPRKNVLRPCASGLVPCPEETRPMSAATSRPTDLAALAPDTCGAPRAGHPRLPTVCEERRATSGKLNRPRREVSHSCWSSFSASEKEFQLGTLAAEGQPCNFQSVTAEKWRCRRQGNVKVLDKQSLVFTECTTLSNWTGANTELG
ncbi:uncharacterized protein LOC132195870 [Neocloeon triangulifer]|uniref:uncharacterized protein LOC132195870 n=1 Tax=Neocloeon triangulifer TaxID=2078957 RepID=UPI00286F3637|nr:uncharacterized protein LOC132195870 [Neocloeon triangulifer]